jgi:hypothetical protein
MDQFSSALGGSGILGGQDPLYWAQRRKKVRDHVYPSGLPTSLVDSTATNPFSPSLLPGCSHVRRYVVDEPGGRSGGSPLYADLCAPTVPAVGKCLVFMAGHIQTLEGNPMPWRDAYALNDGTSPILRMLARGWHVLAMDMPGLGDQPVDQVVVIGGSPVSIGQTHGYSGGFSDGGPNPNRIFLDHAIRGMNQVTESFGITDFAIGGHSGGADTAAMLGMVEDRFKVVHLMSGGWYSETLPDAHIEGWNANPTIYYASLGTAAAVQWMFTVAAALTGRVTVAHSSPTDTQYNYLGDGGAREFAYWQEWTPRVQQYLGSWASVALYQKAGGHDPDAAQAAFIESHLLTNMS